MDGGNYRTATALSNLSMLISDRYTLLLLKELMRREVEKTISKDTLFRTDSFASKIIVHYISSVWDGYLKAMLVECVDKEILGM